MPDKFIPNLLYTSDPTAAPAAGEFYEAMKADLDGALWIRPKSTIGGVGVSQTARNPDADAIAAAGVNALDVACFNYIYDEAAGVWDRERRFSAADNMDGSAEARIAISYLMGYDGANFDRLRSFGDNADAEAVTAAGILATLARLTGYNGATYDRVRSGASNADAIAALAAGLLQVSSHNMGYNGATFDRLRTGVDNSDAVAAGVAGLLSIMSKGQVFNGTNWMRDFKNADFDAVTNSNVGVASASILAADITRKYLLIQNHDDTDSIYLNFGAAATTSGVEIIPGGNYEPLVPPTDEIFAIADAAATTYSIITA